MKWALLLLASISLVELLTWTKFGWHFRKYMAIAVVIAQSVSVGLLIGFYHNVWAGLIFVTSVYRVINLLRLVEGRTDPDYLFIVSRRTSSRLILSQLVLAFFWLGAEHFSIKTDVFLAALGVAQVLMALSIAMSLRRSIRTTRPPVVSPHYSSRDLPSISVLIPARNETEDLEQCLSSVVASSYPKLEILVLDDCSQNKHTPEIIKGFAQAGVRFIAGELPPDSWLAKNYAYEQLALQASGDILVFAGVDTRFSPDTLTLLIETLLDKKKTMASLMPVNKAPGALGLMSYLVQPTRYAWELGLPRRLFNRPPVLSTCWLIYADKLKEFGSFKAVSRSNSPESYFAKKAINEKDSYTFIRSTYAFGLSSQKTLTEQRETAIRTRYPQVHRKLELVCLLTLVEITAFFMPIFSIVWGLAVLNYLIFSLGVISIFWLSLSYLMICRITFSKLSFAALLVWPLAAISDIGLLNYSMWQYEFKEVIWKGRNICLPVMRVQAVDQEQSR